MLEPFDARRQRRARSRSDEDMAGGDLRAAGEPHAMRVDDGRSFLDELGARPQEIGAIGSDSRPISFSLAATSFGQSNFASRTLQPKPAASSNSSAKRLA